MVAQLGVSGLHRAGSCEAHIAVQSLSQCPTRVPAGAHARLLHAAWVGSGDSNLATDWRLGAERIAAVVQEANPRLLIFVEGVESACGEHSWWGGCFTAAGQAPVRLPVEGKLVYSPHVYGPSVHAQAYFSAPDFPNNLPPIWIKHFACVLKDNQGPAIVPGEWG